MARPRARAPQVNDRLHTMAEEPGPAWPGSEGRTGPCERGRKAARGRACMARSAGIVMARTVAGLVAGEIGGQRILEEQCPGEKIE